MELSTQAASLNLLPFLLLCLDIKKNPTHTTKLKQTPIQFKLSLFHLIPTSLEVQSPIIESPA